MIEMGIIVGMGLLVTLVKMSWRWKLWTLSHPLIMDAIIFTLLMILHWGTFSGVMVATIGALTCSLVLSGAKALVGHIEKGQYKPGLYNVKHKL